MRAQTASRPGDETAATNHIGKVFTLKVLHDDEGHFTVWVDTEIVGPYDVRVVKLTHRPRFTIKTLHEFVVREQPLKERLDGHFSVHTELDREINGTHRSFTKDLLNLITARNFIART